jgi:hypothetical protein
VVVTPGGRAVLAMLRRRHQAIADTLVSFRRLQSALDRIPLRGDPEGIEPYWLNGWMPGLDAVSIYAFLALRNPEVYLEVGSGNSTKFARRAISDHGLRTKIISIDPFPRANIDRLCDDVVRAPLEDVPADRFASLPDNSLVFIDCSHRAFQNSDVTVFFTELLPLIPVGSIWGLHDIFLPQDYPAVWANRYFNEQYLLTAYLLGGSQMDDILLPNAYVADEPELSTIVADLFANALFEPVQKSGGCFWMERIRTVPD